MKKILFEGCATAIATPFTESGVNYEEFGKLIDFQIEQGIDALVVCGTTGESATMTNTERKETFSFAVKKVNSRVPVIIGTGSNCTATAIELTKYAESIGADGALVVTPFYNKATQSGLIEHYKAIASSTNLPIIMYSVPSRTGVNILPKTCLELSKISNIVAIKEASGNLSQIAEIASLCGDELTIYSGNDDQTLPILSLGGKGVISVLSNVAPKKTSKMVHDYLSGNFEDAKKVQLESIGLINALFCEVNPIPVKAALNMLGYNFGTPRLPLTPLSDANKIALENEMKKYGLL
ncbi:MAG: 4-hydroxy-tetrahydrodipicolinate synthase [Clostridia bacterium]|nr:4-hydroxy-tetrahydrodipicolinate synthase [Clostridia bacterium]